MNPPPLAFPPALEGACRMPQRTDSTVEILLVEDSPDDADLMKTALHEGNLATRITWVEDGEEALAYLHRQGMYANVVLPDLILLDLHLPRVNGLEVLAEIKQDARLRLIPVVVLTSSDNEEEILEAYDRHVNCCVSKPADQDQFVMVVSRIEQFWLRLVRRP
jgi:CheY-like chemotaxis protein